MERFSMYAGIKLHHRGNNITTLWELKTIGLPLSTMINYSGTKHGPVFVEVGWLIFPMPVTKIDEIILALRI